jgi:[NiFe] hydrogenase diaphorase moiety large subunit
MKGITTLPRTEIELFSRLSTYPKWSTELAETLLMQRSKEPFQSYWILQSLIVIQHHFGCVSTEAQQWLSRRYNINVADVRVLIEFYSFLETQPPPAYRLRFSSNIVEQHAGLQPLIAAVTERLCGTDSDIGSTSCIGLSDHPVSLLLNGYPVTGLTWQNVDDFCGLIKSNTPLQEWPHNWFQVHNQLRAKGPLTSYNYAPGKAIQQAQQYSQEQIIQQITDSGLRGLGGAGFPTAYKWHWCAEQQEPLKYIVCNADEGEPGTFKDRYYLTFQFDRMVEGMVIAAKAVGASKGFIYLRGEYLYLYERLQKQLDEYRQKGWLGHHFDIELHLGAGSYVCGEESALIESLEGKRGIPRSKPPFPGEQGVFGKPTVVNNVETFVCVTLILHEGNESFKAMGTERSSGSRLHSVSGDCEQPGLYELEQGATLRSLLTLCGAEHAQCVQVGGPSGQLVFPEQFDSALDFESPGRGGSIMVFNQTRSTLDIAKNFVAFFRHESCGFCTPCRAGTVALDTLLSHYESTDCSHLKSHAQMIELTQLMADTSHCGLGKTAGLPVTQLLNRIAQHGR